MTTFVLLHLFNNGRQERVEMASRGTRVATHASTTAVNHNPKLWQLPNKAAKTPAGIYLRVFVNPSRIGMLHMSECCYLLL